MSMRILSISKVKDKLNEYVDAVAQTQDQITITKNGAPAAVLVGADEWESLQETLYWLSSVMRSSACARFPAGLSFVVDGDQGSSGCAFPPPGWSGDTPGK